MLGGVEISLAMTKEGRQVFFQEKGWHRPVSAPGDTNPAGV